MPIWAALCAVALVWQSPCAIELGVGQDTDNRKESGTRSFKPNVSPKSGDGTATAKPAAARDDKAREDRSKEDKSNNDKQPGFTLEREAAALIFVRQHHIELADLLGQLKMGNRKEYQRVVHELFRTSERLALSREKDSVRYELELRNWKLDSRIRLLAARMMMSDSLAESQEELKRLLLERTDVQLEQQLLERQRLAARLEKLDASIEKTRGAREAGAQESLDKLLKGIQESQPNASQLNKGPRGKAAPANAADRPANAAESGAK